jgi:hypothetical protein
MALFGSSRDISFMLKINKELINDVIQQEVDFYELYLPETKSKNAQNLYGEGSAQKTYYSPVRLSCLIERDDITAVQEDQFGIDVSQGVRFRFLRDTLKEFNLFPQVGDIIEVRGNFYEVDNTSDNQFVLGKDAEYPKNVGSEFGENLSIICTTHLTRVAKLQIIKARV